MSDQLLGAMQRIAQTTGNQVLIEGRVQSLSGSVANVLLSGSSRPTQAWYAKGISLSPGDACLLVRAPQTDRWVVLCAYNTSLTGGRDIALSGSGEASVKNVAASAYRNAASSVLLGTVFMNNANNALAMQLSLTTTKDNASVLVGVTGYLSGSTLNLWGGFQAIKGSSVVFETRATIASATSQANVSGTGIISNLSPGTHYFNFNIVTSSANAADSISSQLTRFYALEV